MEGVFHGKDEQRNMLSAEKWQKPERHPLQDTNHRRLLTSAERAGKIISECRLTYPAQFLEEKHLRGLFA